MHRLGCRCQHDDTQKEQKQPATAREPQQKKARHGRAYACHLHLAKREGVQAHLDAGARALSDLKAHGKVLGKVEKLAEVCARASATVKEPGCASCGDILPSWTGARSELRWAESGIRPAWHVSRTRCLIALSGLLVAS
jgi:hypothetical protein